MSDFAQTGRICTLQRLNEAHLSGLEAALAPQARAMPLALVLPCHAADLIQPALGEIVAQLAGADYLDEVVVSINGLAEASVETVKARFAGLPRCRLLWTDSPRAAAAMRRLCGGAAPSGKGANLWAAWGLLITEARAGAIATQDSDVVSFRRENLARLCFAALHPDLGYRFAKMYYSRASDRLYGRVSRLFLAPLLQALVRAAGHHPLLDYLQSFRYPLSGECVIAPGLAAAVALQPGWGLEIGLLAETFRRADPRQVAQVDGGREYEHRHHPLGEDGGGLARMSREIALTLLPELAAEGLAVDAAFLGALQSSFAREAEEAVRRSRHLALINGLGPAEDETAGAALFARALAAAGADYLAAGLLLHFLLGRSSAPPSLQQPSESSSKRCSCRPAEVDTFKAWINAADPCGSNGQQRWASTHFENAI